MAASPPRILLCGDVLGRFNQLIKRVQSVNKSTGPFDALLCVGQLFPDSADGLNEVSMYFDGSSLIPIPTYFIGDYGVGANRFLSAVEMLPANKGFKMDGLEVCPNLYWLKGSGKFFLHGLAIAYLSSRQYSDDEGHGRYSRDDVDALRALAEEPGMVDIFMTNEWPLGVSNKTDLSEAPPGILDPLGSDPVIAELAMEIKPRYHIAGTKNVFYAREPYSNNDAVHTTRFIGLGAVGNKEKMKFIHAISPTPASAMSLTEICSKSPSITTSPYIMKGATNLTLEQTNFDSPDQFWRFDVSKKRPRQDGIGRDKLCFKYTSSGACAQGKKCAYRHDDGARDQYLKNICFDFINKGKCERGPDCRFRHSFADEGDDAFQGGLGSQVGRSFRKIPEHKCWFCLSCPDAEGHLVLSIGENYYCALAKGPLVRDHVLLVPIEHHPNTLTASLEAEAELRRYMNALKDYFKKQENAVVFFEWIFKSSPHANLQVVPIPLSKASNVPKIFNFAAKKLGFDFSVPAPSDDHSENRSCLRSDFDGKSNLFYVELPDGHIVSHYVDDKEKFPIQFGREVLAGLLNVAERADWRNSKLSKADELLMVETFKASFEEFDPFS